MTRIGSWLVDWISRSLDADERDVVRGDLAEWRSTDRDALRDLAGLVIRRHAAVWGRWRPWLALLAIVVPLGMTLSLASKEWADGNSIHAWLYANNWTWAYLESPGARGDLIRIGADFVVTCAALVCWAWTIGFALGSLSRRAMWINGALFGLVLFGGTIDSTPPALRNPANAVVFSVTFYRLVFPALLRIVFVLLPALHGMHQAARKTTLPFVEASLWAVAVATLTAAAAHSLEQSVTWGWWSLSTHDAAAGEFSRLRASWQLRLLPFAMAWPAAYIVASASWRQLQEWHK